jgi:hypothetical protein
MEPFSYSEFEIEEVSQPSEGVVRRLARWLRRLAARKVGALPQTPPSPTRDFA